jgi:four helix bundle protein
VEKAQSTNKYRELEERTFKFAEKCRDFVKKLPKTISNIEYGKQLARSSGSQAANYIEANEALSRKDFIHRVRISRKESKESCLWLRLCDLGDDKNLQKERDELFAEAEELRKIFSSILEKSTN